MRPIEFPRIVFLVLWDVWSLAETSMVSMVHNSEADTLVVAQEELLHWVLALKDGLSMSVLNTL